MTNNMPSGAMKHHESAELDSHQMAKMLFFLSSTSDWLVQNSFTMVFEQYSSSLHWAVYHPITVSQLWSLTSQFELFTEELHMASFVTPSSFVRMCTNHLAMKCNYYSRLLKWKYGWCAWRQGESVLQCCCWLGVSTEPGQWFFSQYCIHLLEQRQCCNCYIILSHGSKVACLVRMVWH